MMNGYVKSHRAWLDEPIFSSSVLWHVWSYCLHRANYTEREILFGGEKITLKAGQFITGRYEGSKDCHMKPSTFRDQLAKLKKYGYIDIKSDNKKSVITIVNWALYQHDDSKSDTKPDNNPTTTRHRQEGKKERNNRSISPEKSPINRMLI